MNNYTYSDDERKRKGGFGPYECQKCHRMKCGSHESICSSCKTTHKKGEENGQ